MSIDVKFFASLREKTGKDSARIEATSVNTVADVWRYCVNQAMPSNTLTAVNMEYVPVNHVVKDGDEVAFFPPVTGG
jgi:molybdopterin synthase sulfur carrier subunit